MISTLRNYFALGYSLLLSLSFSLSSSLQAQDFLAADLDPPVPLYSAGEPIESSTGYACPYLTDVDGDGRLDLMVGDFGAGHEGIEDAKFPGEPWGDAEKDDHLLGANGYVSLYLNRMRAEEETFNLVSSGYVKTRQGLAKAPTW